MKNIKFSSVTLLFCMSFVTLMQLASCNKKEEEVEQTYYDVSSMVGITGFSLKENSSVLANLDSVFFSIDLKNGVIFNADSLPVGTNITKLVAKISYPATISEMTLAIEGGTLQKDTVVNYLTNPSDTLDFSGKVTLNLTAQDGETKASYRIKVNVHQWDPDSLIWDKIAMAKLPSRMANPKQQKSVEYTGKYLSMMMESDGSLTLSSTDNLFTGSWQRDELSLPFIPQISTLSASSDALYILSDSGQLMTSTDGYNWTDTGCTWTAMIGGFGSSVLGIRHNGSNLVHCSYPASSEADVDKEFPLTGFSDFQLMHTKWTQTPVGILVGGSKADGSLSNATWGYDGENWALLSDTAVPAIEGASLIPYFSYKRSSASWVLTEFSVWMVVGGKLADGSFNRNVYISYNNGINWQLGGDLLRFPDYIPGFCNADILTDTTPMEANLADAWTEMPTKQHPGRRIAYTLDGYIVEWDCPYLFLFGGEDAAGNLYDSIWRGVLGRLTFTPIF